jgi:hypothetical protein
MSTKVQRRWWFSLGIWNFNAEERFLAFARKRSVISNEVRDLELTEHSPGLTQSFAKHASLKPLLITVEGIWNFNYPRERY